MKNKLSFAFILACIILILSVLYKGLFQSEIYSPNNLTSENFIKLKVKDFFTDEQVSLNKLIEKNNFTIINIWASWCQPCRVEHAYLMQLTQFDNFNLIGINYKDKPEAARNWLNELGDPFEKIVADKDGRAAIDWGVYGVPETYLVDKKGRVRYRHVGPLTEKVLEEKLMPIMQMLKKKDE